MSRFLLSASRLLALLLCAVLLSACVQDLTGPDDPDDPPPPPVRMRTVYDLKVSPRYIDVVGSCDKVFGSPTAGEFQYRVEVNGEGRTNGFESQNYNSRLGVVTGRVAGQQITFAPRTYTWSSMSSPGRIEAVVFGTEWDGAIRDGDMSNRRGARTIPFALGRRPGTVTIGATSECRLVLAYEAEWVQREVPA